MNMSKQNKKPLQNAENAPKCRILQAARELFFSKGVEAVTTDMLAKKAKTSKMTLYKYFANKDELLAEVVADDVSPIFEPLASDISDLESYTKVVLSFCKNLVEIIFDPEIVRFDQLMVSQALSHQELTQIHYNRTYQPTIDRVKQLIELGQQNAYVKPKFDAALLTDILISSVSGLGYTRALHGFEDKTVISNKAIEEIVEVVLGLKAV